MRQGRVARLERGRDAVLHVVVEHPQGDGLERRVDGAELREDVDAVAVVLDHPGDAAHLPLDPGEPAEQPFLVGRVAVGGCGRHRPHVTVPPYRMEHAEHEQSHGNESLTRTAIQATLHCLTGCAIGEVLGMVIATALAFGNAASIGLSIVLAFVFGYSLTLRPVRRAGIPFARAARLAFASDTVSITTMEIVDNLFVALVPGALAAGLGDGLFWWSLLVSLVIAFVAAVPVNRWLIARGKGHAVVHQFHHA